MDIIIGITDEGRTGGLYYTTQVYTTNLLSETSVDAVKEGASQPRDVESLQYQQLYQQQQQPAHAAQPTVAPASYPTLKKLLHFLHLCHPLCQKHQGWDVVIAFYRHLLQLFSL